MCFAYNHSVCPPDLFAEALTALARGHIDSAQQWTQSKSSSLPPNEESAEAAAAAAIASIDFPPESRGSGPFPFIQFDASIGKWIVTAEAKQMLSETAASHVDSDMPLKIISAVGGVGKGKSYLLNRLAGYQDGFVVHDEAQSNVSHELSAWILPPWEGRNDALLLLDTAGMFNGNRRNKKLDEQLFFLASFLSSILIYNTAGGIDEPSLLDIGIAARMAKLANLNGKNSAEITTDSNCAQLVWLLRDFSVNLGKYGGRIEAYLERSLELVEDDSMDNRITLTNMARSLIKTLFPDVSCMTVCRPIISKEQLKHIDKMPFAELPLDFQLDVAGIVDAIRDAAAPKYFARPVTENEESSPKRIKSSPKHILYFAEGLCELLNSNSLDISELWDKVDTRIGSDACKYVYL